MLCTSMSEWSVCLVCADAVHNSHNGWDRHHAGWRHRLAMLGTGPEDAERIAQACHDAGVSFDAASAAVRYALSLSPEEAQRRGEQLRRFAASLA